MIYKLIFIKLYFRLNLFTEKSISACLGIVYLTHLFFLSHPWLTVQEVYQFFNKTILLHVVLVCILSNFRQIIQLYTIIYFFLMNAMIFNETYKQIFFICIFLI